MEQALRTEESGIEHKLFLLLMIVQGLAIAGALTTQIYALSLIPITIITGWFLLSDVRRLYYFFALMIPFSVEVELPGGLGTDLPTEPIMWAITGFSILYLFYNAYRMDFSLIRHPITLLLLLHLGWTGLTGITAEFPIYSVKFLLAKLWYVIPFFFFFIYVFKDKKSINTFYKILVGATLISVTIVMARHAATGFAFDTINKASHPIYRNHVNYACMLIAILPYIWYLWRIASRKWPYILAMIYVIIAIYLSYCRAAILAVFISVAMYYIVKWKLTRVAIATALIGIAVAIPYFLSNGRYLDYAPEYEKTITHEKFDNLIEATYKLEDISTMERLYRWMAGKQMIEKRPVFGYGPSNFYPNYENHTISSFQTYVSNNPEKSGIHSYYLMISVEQGIVGGIIFLLLVIIAFIYGENIYHVLRDAHYKALVMSAMMSLIAIASVLIINDLLEADKVGPFFLIACAIPVMGLLSTRRVNKMI